MVHEGMIQEEKSNHGMAMMNPFHSWLDNHDSQWSIKIIIDHWWSWQIHDGSWEFRGTKEQLSNFAAHTRPLATYTYERSRQVFFGGFDCASHVPRKEKISIVLAILAMFCHVLSHWKVPFPLQAFPRVHLDGYIKLYPRKSPFCLFLVSHTI